ncbi:glycerate kinase type-2 family protein [Anoxynatronum buryatiense]|uniref:Hydroxypyruvate reductase n=1 Tax=Anoxynatronum buryatiense TaxID=489973 RepID=A0AA46AHW3_9CLOT|nr:glycerate kinase [Anoxynatronum buryatiense]SMP43640.1 hydroxypyruvate reductase [Anoxynatronum buryatiense]
MKAADQSVSRKGPPTGMKQDAHAIITASIQAVLPEAAVKKALKSHPLTGSPMVIALGKAAWSMAHAAQEILGDRLTRGLVITKYGHSRGPLTGFQIIEAGHPVPDENAVRGAAAALEMVSELTAEDQVLLLISGGGSSLFEMPAAGVTLNDIQMITGQLLASGASIGEINTIRKRLSAVKGGRFAAACGAAPILAIVLSDVLGDRLDVIASGPAHPDSSTTQEALAIIHRYDLQINESVHQALAMKTPAITTRCETIIAGNVTGLCAAAAEACLQRGYEPQILTTTLDCEAREAGRVMAAMARELAERQSDQAGGHRPKPPCAIIMGGETVVHLMGNGQGGRNQELALAAALGMEGLANAVLFSVGSDGTDGPTDAAGGMVDGESACRMRAAGIDPENALQCNDAYHALKSSDDLVITGPTGTNVNDVAVLLVKPLNSTDH